MPPKRSRSAASSEQSFFAPSVASKILWAHAGIGPSRPSARDVKKAMATVQRFPSKTFGPAVKYEEFEWEAPKPPPPTEISAASEISLRPLEPLARPPSSVSTISQFQLDREIRQRLMTKRAYMDTYGPATAANRPFYDSLP